MLRNLPRKILLIGGFGYIGSQVTEYFKDSQITVLDNLIAGPPLLANHITFIYGDIRDTELLARVIPQFDAIIHLAGIVGEPACIIDSTVSYAINVDGTKNIVRAMNTNQFLVFASTSSVYGETPQGTIVTEKTPIRPTNNYARQKAEAEQYIQQSSTPYCIVRPVTAFGITQRCRLDLLVNTFIYKALTKGVIDVFEPWLIRPMISAVDFARFLAYSLTITRDNTIINLGDSTLTVTKLALAQRIGELTGAKVIESEGSSLDLRHYDIDFSMLRATGFTCTPHMINVAVQQIQDNLTMLSRNPDMYTTPALFAHYLEGNYV